MTVTSASDRGQLLQSTRLFALATGQVPASGHFGRAGENQTLHNKQKCIHGGGNVETVLSFRCPEGAGDTLELWLLLSEYPTPQETDCKG